MSDHRCRSDTRCVALTPDGPALTVKPHTICHSCVTRLQRQLDQLSDIKIVLRMYLQPAETGMTESRVASSTEPSVPIDLHVLDLIDEVGDVIDRTAGHTVDNLIRQPAKDFIIWRRGGRRKTSLDGVDRALGIGIVWRKADAVIGLGEK